MNDPRAPLANPKPALVFAIALATTMCMDCEAPTPMDLHLRLGAWGSALDDRVPSEASSAPLTQTVESASPRTHEAANRRQSNSADDETGEVPIASDDSPHRSNNRWHLDLAMRNSCIKLADTKRQLDRRLKLPLNLDVAHVFDEPYTPIDRKSDFLLASWYAGIGRQENARLIWTYYVGGGAGKDLNHQRFLFQVLEVDFEYVYAYTGITAEYYPWEVPTSPSHFSFESSLRASRPFLLAGLETGYVSAEGEGDYKVAGAIVYHDEQKVRDWLFSIAIGLGWAVPLNDRWSFNLTGDYRFHFYRPDEYNGWDLITGIRYRF